MVKSYALNGADQLTDYGAYDEVVNLTDATPAALEQGSAAGVASVRLTTSS